MLSGWKEIAEALGVSVDTAQRWRRDHGLPVIQPVNGGRVLLSRDDLEEWKSARAVTCGLLRSHAPLMRPGKRG